MFLQQKVSAAAQYVSGLLKKNKLQKKENITMKMIALRNFWQVDSTVRRAIQRGEEFEVKGAEQIHNLISSLSAAPADYPEHVECKCVLAFSILDANHGSFAATIGDVLNLPRVVALRLVLSRYVVPANFNLWIPDRVEESKEVRRLYEGSVSKPDPNFVTHQGRFYEERI